MVDEQEQNTFKVIVDIDAMMSVTMEIKPRLSVLELKSLMSRVNKLFSIADVPIANNIRHDNIGSRAERLRRTNKSRQIYTDDEVKEWLVYLETHSPNELCTHLNMMKNTNKIPQIWTACISKRMPAEYKAARLKYTNYKNGDGSQ